MPERDETAEAQPAAVAVLDDTRADIDADLVEDELLVEEVSIDGMCGVY